jgi:PKD repeat protein
MQLQGKNVFLMTSPDGDPNIYLNYADALNSFVNNGGTVIFCGATEPKSDCIYNTGLLAGAFGTVVPNVPIDVVNLSHPITQGLPAVITKNPKHSYSQVFTNDVTELIDYTGTTVVGYREQGLGKIVYIGFDYFLANDTASIVISNTMQWINDNLIPDFVTISPSTGGLLHPTESQEYTVTITNTGLPEGTYTEYFIVYGNDPDNPIDSVLISVTVGSADCVSIAADVQCAGNVCFTDSISGGAVSVNWDFGDGATSDVENPCHVYTQSGAYNVMMIGCGGFGCDTVFTPVTVALLAADITYSGSLFEDSPVDFASNSQNATSWDWNFGDGNSSTQENPEHTYADPGTYTVTLIATDANGCSITVVETVVILPVGIGEINSDFNISLYPNPANNFSNLEYFLPQATSITVELWNGIGQKVAVIVPSQNQRAGKYIYAVQMDEAGVYYLKMMVGEREIWQKLVNVK